MTTPCGLVVTEVNGNMLCTNNVYVVLPRSTHCVGQGDLKFLHCELHPVSDKWFSLGVQLQVPVETLKCIRRENLSMTERLLEMLTVWLKRTNLPPTWNILTEALESAPVGESLLAQQLRAKYWAQTEGGGTRGGGLSPPVALPTRNITSTSDKLPETAVTPPPVSEQMVPTPQLDSPPAGPSSITGDSTPPPDIPPNPQFPCLTTSPSSPAETGNDIISDFWAAVLK